MLAVRRTRLSHLVAAMLLGWVFTPGAGLAQVTSIDLDELQAPPRALAVPPQVMAEATPVASPAPEQRVALVIGNASYRNIQPLDNPDNDAQSMAQMLNQAGFEVITATNLTQTEMIKVVQDFSSRIATHGPNTVAMIYYAGHGVQIAGENYLIPIDARIAAPSDLTSGAVRLVDLMATLEAIPSRARIVVLDACRNNPFPAVDDAGRGLAIVDAPNGSIVGYSTSPGEEALDGRGNHSPYTQAFLRLARQPNLPIEQLFKRIRLDVHQSTEGLQTPWESSSLTNDFTFFGDAATAAARPPLNAPVVQMASNLPGQSVRQAYDYVLSENSPANYREFIEMFPRDPLADRVRLLLADLTQAAAWHDAVLANSPAAYQSFRDTYADSRYAPVALRLQARPRPVSVLQPTHLLVPPRLTPVLRPVNLNAGRPVPPALRPVATPPVIQRHDPIPPPSRLATRQLPQRMVQSARPSHFRPPLTASRTSFARGSNFRMASGPRFAQSGPRMTGGVMGRMGGGMGRGGGFRH
jgi:hypothetical protein